MYLSDYFIPITNIYYIYMQSPDRQRFNRRSQRESARWQAEREETVRRNVEDINMRVARFRQKMWKLVIRSSLGNPPRAVSSAVSDPNYMCEALLFVLSSSLRKYPEDINRLHFTIQGSTLIIQKLKPVTPAVTDSSPFLMAPRIEVRIGHLQRASPGHASDHVCQGLCCGDKRHGLTRILYQSNFDMGRMIEPKRVQIQTVLMDGTVENGERDIHQFRNIYYRRSSWQNSVSAVTTSRDFWDNLDNIAVSASDPLPDYWGTRACVIQYRENELTGLPELIKLLACVLF